MAMDKKRLLSIVVPTYNERENIQLLYQGIAQAVKDFELIFVDDNSPDGTAQVIREIQGRDSRVRLLQRPAKLGLGSAVLHGSQAASGEWVAMMDADLSHSPAALPSLMAASAGADLVIGSRYIEGGRIQGWPLSRRLASLIAIWVGRLMLRMKVKDPTSGFVLMRRELVEGIRDKLSPRGFKLLLEVLVKADQAKVVEVPITFVNRAYGQSKLSGSEVTDYLKLCWELRSYKKGKKPKAA